MLRGAVLPIDTLEAETLALAAEHVLFNDGLVAEAMAAPQHALEFAHANAAIFGPTFFAAQWGRELECDHHYCPNV